MPEWLIYALICPFLWCFSNLLDQFVVRYLGDHPLAPLGLVGLSALPFMLLGFALTPSWAIVSITEILAGLFAGLLFFGAMYPYLLALKDEDASVAIPMFQLIPVFVYIFGWAVFGETLSALQLLGGGLIIAGALFISVDFKQIKFKWRVVMLMFLASLAYAIYTVWLRAFAPHVPSANLITLMMTAWFIAGACIMLTHRPIQAYVLQQIKASRGGVLLYGIVQEAADVLAQKFAILALAIAPTAVHVQLVGGLQAVMIIGLAGIMGLLVPKHFERLKLDKVLLQKIICTLVMLAGLALLIQL